MSILKLGFPNDEMINSLITPREHVVYTDIRYSSIFDELETARVFKDHRTLEEGQQDKRADWAQVVEICTSTLMHISKDLQIAAYLSEAWFVLYGFKGLIKGLGLMLQLKECPSYYKNSKPWLWVIDKIALRIYNYKLTQKPKIFKLNFWLNRGEFIKNIQMENIKNMENKDDREIITAVEQTPINYYEQGAINLRDFTDFFDTWLDSINCYTQDNLEMYENLTQEVFSAMELLQDFFSYATKTKQRHEQPQTNPNTTTTALPPTLKQTETLTTDEDVVKMLSKVYYFLQQNKSQSLTYYLVEASIKWYNTNLEDLLKIMLDYDVNLKDLYKFLVLSKIK